MSNGIELLLSDNHGIYIPQHWAMYCQDMDGVSAEDMEILKAGPDHEWYWLAWDEVLFNASATHNGKVWRLWQDGDLFAYCEELMTDEEYKEFFGVDRDGASQPEADIYGDNVLEEEI